MEDMVYGHGRVFMNLGEYADFLKVDNEFKKKCGEEDDKLRKRHVREDKELKKKQMEERKEFGRKRAEKSVKEYLAEDYFVEEDIKKPKEGIVMRWTKSLKHIITFGLL